MDTSLYIQPGPDDPRGDSGIAAAAAVNAFQDGRFRLGWEFARIALKAKEWADTAQQLPAPVPTHDEVHTTGAWLSETQIITEAEMIETRHKLDRNREDARPIEVPRTTRCVAGTILDGVRVQCHGVLAYDEDGSTIGARGWYHLHGDLNDHQAVPAPATAVGEG